MMKKLIAFLCLAIFVIGCNSFKGKEDFTNFTVTEGISASSEKVGDVSKAVGIVAVEQGKINNNIGANVTEIKRDSGPKYEKQTASIYGNLEQSSKLVEDLKAASQNLNESQAKLIILEQQSKELTSKVEVLNKDLQNVIVERDKLKSELEASTKKYLNKILAALIALGIVAIGISGFVAYGALQAGQSPFKAGAIAVGGIMVTSVSIGFMYYSESISKIIFVTVIVVILSLAYKFYLEMRERMKIKNEIDLKDKVIEYNTRLTEQIKEEVMTPEERAEWFGKVHSDGKAGVLQKDERIKKVVHEFRKKINELDKPVMEGK